MPPGLSVLSELQSEGMGTVVTGIASAAGGPAGHDSVGAGWLGEQGSLIASWPREASLGTSAHSKCPPPGAIVLEGLRDAVVEPTVGVATEIRAGGSANGQRNCPKRMRF